MSHQNSWVSPAGYIFAMIGSAVGFANILGFSAKCYAQGGGAFLIPLFISLFFLGIPLLILEGVIGKKLRSPLIGGYRKILGKTGAFLGWTTIIGVITISGYYSVITGWSLAYMYFSLAGKIPKDTEHFFTHDFLQTTTSLEDWGQFSWLIGFFTLLVLFITYIVNGKPISKGIEKICAFFLPLLFALLVILFVTVCFLPGATTGFIHFLKPDFSKLLSSDIWISAFGHVFFSLSVALGIIVGYSKYTDESVDIVKSMIWVAFGDITTSIIAGLVIFGGLGYMAQLEQADFAHVVSFSTFSLGFVVFPKIFQTFPGGIAEISSAVFFLCLFIAGITGVFSITEAISGNFESEFKLTRKKSVSLALVLTSICGILFCFGNGPSLMGTIDEVTAGVNVLCSGLFQIIVFLYFTKTISDSPEWFKKDGATRNISFLCLKYLSPILLLIVLGFRIETELNRELDTQGFIKWSWFFGALLIGFFLSQTKMERE